MKLTGLFKKHPDSRKPNEVTLANNKNTDVDILSTSEQLLMEVTTDLSQQNASLRIPIAEIATLGGGLSSLLPSLRTITQTAATSGTGLYRLANAGVGDALKAARDGSLWGAMKTASGASKMAKFVEAGSLRTTTQTIAAVNPAMLVMAAALAGIEKKLGEIEDMEKQILSFLEQDKQAAIEADLVTLTSIVKEYKYNWDNELYCMNHHMQVLDIKRAAEQNIAFYQKQIGETFKSNPGLIIVTSNADATQKTLKKDFQYYKLSLYIYSFSSFMEVMLSGNVRPEYLHQIQVDINEHGNRYHDIYTQCHGRISQLSSGAVEPQILKSLGGMCKSVSGWFGGEGAIAEWLNDHSSDLESSSKQYAEKAIESFSQIQDLGNAVFIENLNKLEWLYGEDPMVLISRDSVYLVGSSECE